MTPRERSIDTLRKNWVEGKGPFGVYPLNDDHLVSELEEMIFTDREALQSEIVRRLQLERAEASSNAWLALNAAIGIVQAVFARSSQSEESKPEKLMISLEEFNRCIKQANENAARIQADSDRRVLAEREACAKIVFDQSKGFEVLLKHSPGERRSHELNYIVQSLHTAEAYIRARSNPAPIPDAPPSENKALESPKITFAGIQPD